MAMRDVMTALEPKRREAAALFAQGCGYKKAARLLGISVYTARDWNRQFKQGQFHTELPDWIRGYSDKQKADVLALHARGFSSYRIAKNLGISPGTCSKWVRESHLLRKQLDV